MKIANLSSWKDVFRFPSFVFRPPALPSFVFRVSCFAFRFRSTPPGRQGCMCCVRCSALMHSVGWAICHFLLKLCASSPMSSLTLSQKFLVAVASLLFASGSSQDCSIILNRFSTPRKTLSTRRTNLTTFHYNEMHQ